MAAAMTETAHAAIPPQPTQAQANRNGNQPTQPLSSRTRASTGASASSLGDPSAESTSPRTSPSLQLRDGQWSFRPAGPVPDGLPNSATLTSGAHSSTPGTLTPSMSTPGASTPTPAFLSQFPISTTTTSQIILPARRPSETRRVRSDALVPQARHMSITMGKRPSIVTGGYESSSEDDDDDEASEEAPAFGRSTNRGEPRTRGLSIGAPHSPTSGPAAGNNPAKRHRPHGQPNSPTTSVPLSPGTLQGLGLMNSHTPAASGRRRAQSLISPSMDSPSPPGSASRRSSRLLRPPLASPLSPRRVASSSGIPSGMSVVDRPSPLHSRMPSDSTRSTSMRSVNSIPEGQVDAGPSNQSREVSLRKHKQRERDARKRAFGSSLGLGAAPREAVLSPDQIQDLLSDVDVSSAIQRISSSKPRRLSTYARDRSPSPSPVPQTEETPAAPHSQAPFLVSAPPALTTGDWPGRSRTVSVSSTLAPPPHDHRAPSPRSDAERDRMGFVTHPISPIASHDDDDGWTDGGNSDVQQTAPGSAAASSAAVAPSPTRSSEAPLSAPSEMSTFAQSKSDRKISGRRRISGLFGTIRKKRDSSPPLLIAPAQAPAQAPARGIPQPPPPPQQHQHHQDKIREQEMRIAEQGRREEELVQERMYRATIQVRSHPASQRRAQRTALHLDAYYAVVHEGLENPPKFNPLAVLRWSKRVEDQRAAKAKWEAEDSASRASGSLHGLSRPGSITSPQPEQFRMSLEAARRTPHSPLGTRSVTSMGEPVVALGWHYSLADVDAYNACGGKVEFFIPPIPESIPSPTSPRKSSVELRPRRSISSSVDMDSSLNNDHLAAMFQGPGSPAPLTAVDDGNMSSLSRTPSFDISRSLSSRNPRTGGLPHSSLTKSTSSLGVLKVPFEKLEKLSSVARRNISMSVSPVSAAMEVDEDPSRRPGWLAVDAPNAPGPSPGPSPAPEAPTTHLAPTALSGHGLRDRVRGFVNVASSANWNNGQHTTGTSDEEHHGFRKLFRGSPKTRGHAHTDSSSRVEALRALENIVGHERQLRYEITSSRHPTERERQAQEDLIMLENQIYDERMGLLNASRQRVDDMANDGAQMGTLIAQFISAVDQAKTTFSTAADIDIAFDNLDALRRPRRIAPIAADDESADSVAPLRGEESDRGGFSAGGGVFSDGWTGRPQQQRARRQSMAPVMPNLTYVYAGYNRRSLVDPNLGEPVDPIRRVELACERARECVSEMTASREDTRRRLQGMIETINGLIAQKDSVRRWTTRTMDQISQLKDERNNLRLKIRGGMRPRLARVADSSIDIAARWILGAASIGFRLYRMVTGRGASLPWALFMGLLAFLLGYFYIMGEAAPDIVGAAGGVVGAAGGVVNAASSVVGAGGGGGGAVSSAGPVGL